MGINMTASKDALGANSSRNGRTLSLAAVALAGFSLASTNLLASPPGEHGDQNKASDLSSSFQCPEDFASAEAKDAELKKFLRAYVAAFPSDTIHDLMRYRYRLLVSHSCSSTLQYMLGHVSPTTDMLLFNGNSYGPKTEEFDPTTKVWTEYYTRNGEAPEIPEEELIFNFYGWDPATSADAIAKAFINRGDSVKILAKFAAPDDLTRTLAYTIVSETPHPGRSYSYVNVTKITSAGSGTYAVTFSKKIVADGTADLTRAAGSWVLSEEGQTVLTGIHSVGVNAEWQEYLTKGDARQTK
jgi:hypothetical protein